jgi:hypothetical protein
MNQDTLQEFKEISETLADAPYIVVSKIYIAKYFNSCKILILWTFMLFHQYNREVENGITNEEFVEWCLG